MVGIPSYAPRPSFLLSAHVAGKTVQSIVYNLFSTPQRRHWHPISVCCTYIMLFIILALSWSTGIANFFIEGANAIAGSPPAVPPGSRHLFRSVRHGVRFLADRQHHRLPSPDEDWHPRKFAVPLGRRLHWRTDHAPSQAPPLSSPWPRWSASPTLRS